MEVHDEGEIPQVCSSTLGDVFWQRYIRNIRGIHISTCVTDLFVFVYQRRAGDVEARERIALLLNQGVSALISNNAIPMGWRAGVRQFIKSRVIKVISIRRAVRVDHHTGSEKEDIGFWQLPNRHFANMPSISIRQCNAQQLPSSIGATIQELVV